MSDAVFQSRLPFLPWMDPRTARLPGILPVEGEDWLRVDDAYAGQMALRDDLIARRPDAVHGLLPQGQAAAAALYAVVLDHLRGTDGFRIGLTTAERPDGVTVALDPTQPLLTLGRLVQEDLCLMQAEGAEHALTGAILCFPASWTLSQKLGRPLIAIHTPVPQYEEGLARRVQRLFDAIRPEQPLWRMNYLTYDDPTLHQPRLEGESRPRPTAHVFVRCERQCLLRLPVSRAVVFSIHTYLVRSDTLTPDELARLQEAVH